jgi:hypothetical protein
VEIPKDEILDLLREQGKSDQAEQAEHELADQVDPERHSGLLEKFGLVDNRPAGSECRRWPRAPRRAASWIGG